MTNNRPRVYRVLVPSIGGQGGGTISEVLYRAVIIERERVAEANGILDRIARTDLEYRYMIPGLAQRNGSVYSAVAFVSPLELELPESIVIAERFHTASVDVMIAQELAEAVRFAGEGLLKDDSTAIVNEHRFLTTVEKMPITKDLIPMEEQIAVLKRLVGKYVGIDAHELALSYGMRPVYANTILLGALAASNVLPISMASYIAAIKERFSGKVMDNNIKAFEIGYKHIIGSGYNDDGSKRRYPLKRNVNVDYPDRDMMKHSIDEILQRNYKRIMLSRGRREAERYVEFIKNMLLVANNCNNNSSSNNYGANNTSSESSSSRIDNDGSIPDSLIKIIADGVVQLVEFEGWHHADRYMSMVMDMLSIDKERGDGTFRLSKAYAMHLAGRLMRWEGPFEVARIKSMKSITDMLERYKDAYGNDVIVNVEALLQPNVEEMYGMIPKRIHDIICKIIPSWPEYLESRKYNGKSISINMTSIGGYLGLWLLWKLSFMHRYSVRYNREMGFVEHFSRTVKDLVAIDYELAYMVADYAQYIRGFAHIRTRNMDAFNTLVEHVVMKGLEMDGVLANSDHRITKAALRAAMNLITLDGEGIDGVIKFMDELYILFKNGEYNKIYLRLAMRQLVPI